MKFLSLESLINLLRVVYSQTKKLVIKVSQTIAIIVSIRLIFILQEYLKSMSKKRTRKQKEHAQNTRVNSQLGYKFNKPYNLEPKNVNANISEKTHDLGSIKKELFKSLTVATLILIALMVLYWVS